MQKKSLGEYLVEKGVLTEDRLRQALDVQKSAPGDLGNILIDLDFASERDVAQGRAQEMGLQYVDLARAPIDPEAVKLIPEHMSRRFNALAIKKENNRIFLAISDPKFNQRNLEDIRIVSKHQPIPVFVSAGDLKEAMSRYLGGNAPRAGGNGLSATSRPGSNGTSGAGSGPIGNRPGTKPVGKPANGNGAKPAGGNGNGVGPSALPAIIKDDLQTPAIVDANSSVPANPMDVGFGGVPSTIGGNGGGGGNGNGSGSTGGSGGGGGGPISELSSQIQGDLLNLVGTDDEDEDTVREMSDDAPIIRISFTIIQQAIKEGASDIHIEPEKRGVRIRYRIDGVLNEIMTVPNHIKQPLIARFKIMADLNIAERRVPQDGRIPVRSEGKDYDLRVSTVPTTFGEKIVMRILDKSNVMLTLDQLGFAPDVRSKIEELVVQPNGMLLITGPTGSGKTTTLYSILSRVATVEKNVMTAEDPAEYQLSGINQVSMNKKAGLTFALALRAFLRQDPDIIMVGEMRDLETSQIAVEAALTGHFVLSTLHTNDAPSAVLRLADMGVETFLIANTVTGVVAQRLARRICSNCKESYQAPAATLRRFGFDMEDPDQMVTLYHGTGCDRCRGTGYKGRLGVYELMALDDTIRELIVMRAPQADIKKAAKDAGMKEMREDGLWKVLQGYTTPDEVMRVVFTAGMD